MGKYQAMVALAMPQELDEHIRPLRLFHETAGERAKEIDGPQRRLARKADAFETYGMQSLFASEALGGARESSKTLPSEMRQRIVDLPFEHPAMSWREIAEMCSSRYARRPDHTSVQHIATSGPPPTRKARRYQSWHEISDPAVRKLAAVRLHAEGWSITSIAKYVQCTRHTVYDTLERWTQEGVAGLDAKPSGRKGPRKVTLKIRNEIRKLQENPRLGRRSRSHGAFENGHRGQSGDMWQDFGRTSATVWPGKAAAAASPKARHALQSTQTSRMLERGYQLDRRTPAA